jgi:hypothetical protein
VSKVLPPPEVSIVAFTDFVLALSGLLGSLLIPFAGVYCMLRQRRRAAVAVPVSATGKVN